MSDDYVNIRKIPYKIRRFQGDLYYPIVNPTVIRRNFSFREDKIIQQKILFDFEKVVLLSKIHIKPNYPKIMKIEIGNDNESNKKLKTFLTIEEEKEVVAGKIRVVNAGSLPCRYIRITFLKGCPIMDYSTIEFYGIQKEELPKIFSEEIQDLVYYNTYNFIYEGEG